MSLPSGTNSGVGFGPVAQIVIALNVPRYGTDANPEAPFSPTGNSQVYSGHWEYKVSQ
mgnify:CR=1 FL=1